MREGAWLNAHTGAWSWITEHASWIQNLDNALSLGMDDETLARLASIPWDFNGPGREAILRVAMDAGFPGTGSRGIRDLRVHPAHGDGHRGNCSLHGTAFRPLDRVPFQ